MQGLFNDISDTGDLSEYIAGSSIDTSSTADGGLGKSSTSIDVTDTWVVVVRPDVTHVDLSFSLAWANHGEKLKSDSTIGNLDVVQVDITGGTGASFGQGTTITAYAADEHDIGTADPALSEIRQAYASYGSPSSIFTYSNIPTNPYFPLLTPSGPMFVNAIVVSVTAIVDDSVSSNNPTALTSLEPFEVEYGFTTGSDAFRTPARLPPVPENPVHNEYYVSDKVTVFLTALMRRDLSLSVI